MPTQVRVAGVVHELCEALGTAFQLVVQEAEQAGAAQLGGQIPKLVEVVANDALAVDRAANARVELPLAAFVADGEDLELAEPVREAGDTSARPQIELAIERVDAVSAESGVARPGRTVGNEAAEIAVLPAHVFRRPDALALLHAAEDAEVGAAAIERGPPGEVHVNGLAIQPLVPAVASAYSKALVIGV